jgi:hypothetical protein
MVNKHYPQQFKADGVALYRTRPGATIASIADDLRAEPVAGLQTAVALCPSRATDDSRRSNKGATTRLSVGAPW